MQDYLEKTVIRSAQVGDQEAWAKLYEWHFEATYFYCLRLCRGRQEMAEESTQETLITAAGGINRFKSQSGPFRSWLFGIARHKVLQIQTAETRRKGRDHHYYQDCQARSDSKTQEGLKVHEILAQLPLKYRSVLESKYFNSLTIKEIACELNTSVDAAESLLRRARAKFASLQKG